MSLSWSSEAAQSSVAATTQETLAATYSTSAGGNSYLARVDKSGEEYIASIPGVLGASAEGPNLQSAETRLASKIDFMV